MALAQWPLHCDRPLVEVAPPLFSGGRDLLRCFPADTGAGDCLSVFSCGRTSTMSSLYGLSRLSPRSLTTRLLRWKHEGPRSSAVQ
jgi:hypothetical protein